jgi:hypothetical protein
MPDRNPPIHGNRRTLTASNILGAIAADLSQIKSEDGLTYADIGHVLGKSEDQAAKYCDGSAEMGAVTYTFARREWNGRFTGRVDAMIGASRPPRNDDRAKLTALLCAAQEVASALENDDEMDGCEVAKARRKLEAAQEALAELLRKLSPVRVA